MARASKGTTFADDNYVKLYDAASDGGPVSSFHIAHLDDSAADVRVIVITTQATLAAAPANTTEGVRLSLGARARTWFKLAVASSGRGGIHQVWARREAAGANITFEAVL